MDRVTFMFMRLPPLTVAVTAPALIRNFRKKKPSDFVLHLALFDYKMHCVTYVFFLSWIDFEIDHSKIKISEEKNMAQKKQQRTFIKWYQPCEEFDILCSFPFTWVCD